MDVRYYMVGYRSEALIASHLDPESFGSYMAVGTKKLTRGSLLFFEIDRSLKSDFFRLHDIDKRCAPHPDGKPKRSKYISIYRVLENLDLSFVKKLYLVTADGRTLGIDPQPYQAWSESAKGYLYQELCPVHPLIISALAPRQFCQFMTNPEIPLYLPRIFFANLRLDHDAQGHLAGSLPYRDPLHIEECLRELSSNPEKMTKTVSRTPHISAFYRTIHSGFFLGDRSDMLYFPFPQQQALEGEHARWWRSAQET